MYQKLQTYLKENKMNFLIKYDSIRKKYKYTTMIFDTVKNERIAGGDTTSILETQQKITQAISRELDFSEINNLFFKVEQFFRTNTSIVIMLSVNYKFKTDALEYLFYLNHEDKTKHNIFCTFNELNKYIEENYG